MHIERFQSSTLIPGTIMLHISKNRVQHLLMLEHLARLHQINDAITFFEKRYNKPFPAFEELINTAQEENMKAWDDYIEWLAFEQQRKEILATLKELRNGEFELA